MPQWTEERPLRITTGFTYLGTKFTEDKGLKHVSFSTADGALEAAPAMGISDAIMDLVGSGTTLRENNLKEIEDGVVLESQAVLVGSKKSLTQRDGVLDITHEILERLEAHLRASGQYTVTANMKGSNADEVAERILGQASLSGLQGPTISPVYTNSNGKVKVDYYAIVICVPRKALYDSVKQLRLIGGSGVLVSPLTYIFEEETPKWKTLLKKLGIRHSIKGMASLAFAPFFYPSIPRGFRSGLLVAGVRPVVCTFRCGGARKVHRWPVVRAVDFPDSFFEDEDEDEDEVEERDPFPIAAASIAELEEKEMPPCPPGLRQYETMAVLRPDMSEDERIKLTERYEELLITGGGMYVEVFNRGVIPLAYTIKKKDKDGESNEYFDGIYLLFSYFTKPASILPLETRLKTDDDVIRSSTFHIRKRKYD
ncbi:hypothetical protein HPP92_003499 [Vanilla planifolia]|uniref:ATP phosphoribosyltransferase n=2 Tax=Vanilla planifolia TaxID=51239 RepID=A0A835SFQ5_VANPL|nr:hypothetical protein HPP92_003499 [Vanilla planifolia]